MIDVELVNQLHQSAMSYAAQAVDAETKGEPALAKNLFRQAYNFERQAAELVAPDETAEPSRSILLRSAASLALDCDEFRDAERLVAVGLAGNPPNELQEELRDLLETVYFKRHLDLRGLELDPIEFQMSLVGGAVGFGVIESSQFIRRAETLQKLLIRAAERHRGIAFRDKGAPSKKDLRDFEIYFSSSRAASYALTVRLGRPKRQLELPFNRDPSRVVLDDILKSLDLFDRGEFDTLKQLIPDQAYFNNFSALAKRLAPDGEKIKTVGFTTAYTDGTHVVALTHPPLSIWTERMSAGDVVEVIGRVYAADEAAKKKKHPVIGVEEANGKVSKIQVPPGILHDIVSQHWGDEVRVKASRSKNGQLIMVEIDRINDS
jgi:hypothetical protein